MISHDPKAIKGARHVEFVGRATLILGDCLDVMPSLPKASHVITDPPYESHMHAAKRGKKAFGSARRIRVDGHANPPPVDFASIDGVREPFADRLAKICDGWVLIFSTPEGIAPWCDEIERVNIKYKRACFWVKPDSAPQFNGQGPAMAVESFVAAWCGAGVSQWNGGGKRNFWIFPTNNSERHGVHPTEKPLALMRALVRDFTRPGQVVLDPFMGSGSTGVAAVQTDRFFVGIETSERYFEIACERLRDAQKTPFLFSQDGAANQDSFFSAGAKV
jgi:DNA modification methylase